jgi:hypothetical protein
MGPAISLPCSQVVPILSQMNPFHVFLSYSFGILFRTVCSYSSLRLSLPRVFLSGFLTKTLYAFFISLVRTKRCTQLNLFDLISQVICRIQNNVMSKYRTPRLFALNSMWRHEDLLWTLPINALQKRTCHRIPLKFITNIPYCQGGMW